MKKLFMTATVASALTASTVSAQEQTSPEPSGAYFGSMPEEVYMAKITVSDIVKSYEFYTKVLGMKLVTSKVLPMAGAPTKADNEKQFLEVALNFTGTLREPMLILIKQKDITPDPAQAAQTWLAFKVADGQSVMAAGAKFGHPATRPWVPARKMGFMRDPDGYTVEVLQLPSFPK